MNIFCSLFFFLGTNLCILIPSYATSFVSFPNIETRIVIPTPLSALNLPENELALCQELLTTGNPEYLDIQIGVPKTSVRVYVPSLKSSYPGNEIFNNIMAHWKNSGDYTSKDIESLTQVNSQLPWYRTYWIQTKYKINGKTWMSGLRIFDASTPYPLTFNISWKYSRNVDDYKSPIEYMWPNNGMVSSVIGRRNYRSNKDNSSNYLWHIGLMSVSQGLRDGVVASLHHSARLLDHQYNNKEMETFSSIEWIKNLDMIIFSSCRYKLLKHYRKFGFRPRYIVDSSGNVDFLRFDNGMIYIEIKGHEFLQKYFFSNPLPNLQIEGSKIESDVYAISKNTLANRQFKYSLERRPPNVINDFEIIHRVATESLLQRFQTMCLKPSQNNIRTFSKFFYSFLLSLENSKLRPKKWILYYNMSLDLLNLTQENFYKKFSEENRNLLNRILNEISDINNYSIEL